MKNRNMAAGIVLMAIIMVSFCAGCENEKTAETKNEGKLISLSIGDAKATRIPAVISRDIWVTREPFDKLAAEYTVTLNFGSEDDLVNVTGIAEAGKNDVVEYIWTNNSNERPSARTFVSTDTPISPERGAFLYIRVTSGNGNTINYYRFKIMTPEVPATGFSLDMETLTLTLFAKEKLSFTFEPPRATNRNITWTSSDDTIVSVTPDGVVKALRFTNGEASTNSSDATATATITAKTEDGNFTDTITITATMEGQVAKLELPPLKDQFSEYFMLGNIFDPNQVPATGTEITDQRLLRHYNVLTHQNNMKPSYMFVTNGTREQYNANNMATAMRMIDAALAADIKVVGHTLLWHSQNAAWMNALRSETNTTAKETALEWMKEYITYVVTHYKGKIYSWDVLNEAFPDGVNASADWKTAMRSGTEGNPWFVKIGADFVYEGFKAARLADPDAILYYNDYNLDTVGKSTMVRNMVRDVNQKWRSDPLYDSRHLIEGIGMQSHHNTNVAAASIKASLDRFRELDVRISISELDVLSQTYGDYSPDRLTPINSGKLTAANLYGQYFTLFLENSDIIERVTFWGQADNNSWRSTGLPQLFDSNANRRAKPAYYKVMEALEAHEAKLAEE